MVQPFEPARWLRGPHAQTVFGTLLRRAPRLPLRRERWELSDGDFLDVDRLDGPVGAPLLVVLHGLEGSASSHYVRGLLARAQARGWRGLALNFRSCSGEPNRLHRFYHSGETGDLGEAVRRARSESPHAPLLLAGCSLGGNVVVKWLGEQGETANVSAAVALSVPFDLKLCARALDSAGAMAFVYRTRFLRTLKRKSLEKARRFPQLDRRRVCAARTLFEFDEAVTAPVHGFAGAEDYWAQSSSAPFVSRVRVPLLLISAEDDPFIPPQCLPREAAAANPRVALEVCPTGGHLGFVAGPWIPWFWAEWRATEFLAAHVSGGARRTASNVAAR
ncbi:MAG TPA: alpha/beta fold hydrolase [Myxococcales bacterium]|nr:alpha/beta fold hydrolase [Myxococcales bacterium]